MDDLKENSILENAIKSELVGLSILFVSVFLLSAFINGFDIFISWIAASGSFFLKNFFIGIIALSFGLIFFSVKRYLDLTNELRRRRQYQNSYERYKQYTEGISEEISEMVFFLDHEMRIKYLNKPALIRNPKAKGRFFYDTFTNFNYKIVEQFFQKAFRSQTMQKGVIWEKPKKDIHEGIKWNLTAIPVIDDYLETVEVIMIISFVSEVESNKPFRRSLESFVKNTDDAMILFDKENKILFWNNAAEKLYGYTSNEIAGSSINKIMKKDAGNHFFENENFANRTKSLRLSKGNKQKWVAFSRIPLINEQGVKNEYMDISCDISDIIEQEYLLEKKLNILESVPAVFQMSYCFVDDTGHIIVCDDHFTNISGLKTNDPISMYPGEFALTLNKKQSKYRFRTKRISNSFSGISGDLIYSNLIDEKNDHVNPDVLGAYLASSDKFCMLESESEGMMYISDHIKEIIKSNNCENPTQLLHLVSAEHKEKDAFISSQKFDHNTEIESELNKNGITEKYIIKNIAFSESGSKFRVVQFEKIELIKPEIPKTSENFQKIYNTLDFGVSVMKKNNITNTYTIVQINDYLRKVESMIGKKFMNKNMDTFVPVRKYSEKFRMLNRVLKTGEPESYEVLLKTDEGYPIKWQEHHLVKLDDNHVSVAMIDIDKTIQERKKQKEEVSYRNYLHSFKGIAYRLDLNMEPVFYIGSVYHIIGYSQNELADGTVDWTSLIHSEDRDIYLDYRRKVKSMPGNEYNIEYRIKHRNGNELWLQEHLHNTTDENGLLNYIDGTIYDITQRKIAELELKESRSVLRALTEHFESVRESEKKELAHEIHDDLGHALTVLKLDLAWVLNKKFIKEDTLHERIGEMSKQIDQIIKKVRYISTELRPSILDHFGIIAAIEWKTSEFQKRTAIRCRLSIQPIDIDIDEHTSTIIFRIFQEAMTNAARHANPSRIDISLFIEDHVLNLTVSDNGIGMKQESLINNKSLGLVGIKERAKFIGGEVFINSVVNYGTTITLKVPLKKQHIA